MKLNHEFIAQWRLSNQKLSATSFTRPEEVVNWLVAVQAQDYYGAIWSLGLRLSGATGQLIDRAFDKGAILRTHLLRPTWHFVTPADIRWLLALTAPRVQVVNGTMYRKSELDPPTLTRCNDLLARALQGGQFLTREELAGILTEAGIADVRGFRLTYIMMFAELEGIICSGPRRGKQFTYALLAERAPQARKLTPEEALAELAGRYFRSRGPATVYDFATWSGLTLTSARKGLDMVRTQFEEEALAGQTYWFPKNIYAAPITVPQVFMLSIYDEIISGYKDRSAMADEETGNKLIALGNALRYIVVLDGRVVGTWRRSIQGKAVEIETDIYVPLKGAEKEALVQAAEEYGRFLGASTIHLASQKK